METSSRPRVRLAELVAALSLGVDLGFGQPMEHVLRQCLIALRLAERIGLDDEERATVYYTALLITVGCHTDAHEQAKWFGDDIALKAIKYDFEPAARGVASMLMIGAGNPPLHRFRVGLEFALSGHREVDGMMEHHAAIARLLAEQLGLPPAVLESLGSAYEQWDGHGWPGGLAGEDIPLPRESRTARGIRRGRASRRRGRGGGQARAGAKRQAVRPGLAALVCEEGELLLAGLDSISTWEAVIGAEPALAITLSDDEFDRALEAIANFVDLKSPFTLGHSRAVADLAAEAGRRLRLDEEEIRTLRRAALVEDLGRLGVSNAIWDKPGSLGPGEWERVRMHPYLTERMLEQSAALASLGALAVQHHERLDGSGYPRGLAGPAISRLARILGAADAYQSSREPRPHRPALEADEAAANLRAEAAAGRLDADAVEAVLGAAGHRVARRREGPGGLTAREVEVLQLVPAECRTGKSRVGW